MQHLHVIKKEFGSNKFSTDFRNSVFALTTPVAKDALFNHTRGLAEIQYGLPSCLKTHLVSIRNFLQKFNNYSFRVHSNGKTL